MKRLIFVFLLPLIIFGISGCAPLIIGVAAGGLGVYAVSKDTVEGQSDKQFESLWESALIVSRIRGTIKQEDDPRSHIELTSDSAYIWITLVRLTQTTTRIRISARKHHFPNIDLARDFLVKIISEAK